MLEARSTINLIRRPTDFCSESYPKPSRSQEKWPRYWGSQKGHNVLGVCGLVAGHLLIGLYFFCFTSLQCEPPVMPTNWPSLHTEVDWLIYFHCQHSSELSSYIWSWHRTKSPSTMSHQAQLLTDLFCALPLAFCLALKGYEMKLVPWHTLTGNTPAGEFCLHKSFPAAYCHIHLPLHGMPC